MNNYKALVLSTIAFISLTMAGAAYARCVSICGYSTNPMGEIEYVYICDENGNVCRVVNAKQAAEI